MQNKYQSAIIIVTIVFAIFMLAMFANDIKYTGFAVRHTENLEMPENVPANIMKNVTENIYQPTSQPPNTVKSSTNIIPDLTIQTSPTCVDPSENLILTQSTTLCRGNYTFDDSAGNGVLSIYADNVILDCNNSVFTGHGVKTAEGESHGLHIIGVYNNITIKNCVFNDYYTGILLQQATNVHLINININNTNSSGIYAGAMTNLIIENTTVSFSYSNHNLYIDTYIQNKSKNIIIKNSIFTHSVNCSGIQINSANVGRTFNISIFNNEIGLTDQQGINDLASDGARIFNNTIHDTKLYGGIVISYNKQPLGYNFAAINGQYFNNTLYNIGMEGVNGDEFFVISNYSNNVSIYNNKYLGSKKTIPDQGVIYFDDSLNGTLTIQENTSRNFSVKLSNNKEVILSNENRKFYSFIGNFFTTSDLYSIYPYNDIKNLSNGVILASNADSFNITLALGQRIEIGNFTSNKTNPLLINHVPNVSVYLDNDLNCSFNVTDADNDNVSSNVYFYNNSILYESDLNVSGSIIASASKVYPDVWYCKVTANDTKNVTVAYSNNITINHQPDNPIVNIFSDDNTTISDLNCSVIATDPDNSSLNVTISWYKNGIFNMNGLTVPHNSLTINDVWYCSARSYDGLAYSNVSYSSNLTILQSIINSPPNDPTPELSDDLNCSSIVTDPDLNLINVTTMFYLNGLLNVSSTVEYTANSMASESITRYPGTYYCSMQSNDGINESDVVNSNVVNVNSSIGIDANVNITGRNASFNFSVIDDFSDVLTCNVLGNELVVNNGTENTLTLALSPNIYAWNVSCNDSFNTNSSVNQLFTINSSISINLSSPINNYTSTNDNVNFVFKVIDDTYQDLTCNLFNYSINTQSGKLNNVSFQFAADTYVWNIICNDSISNNATDVRILNINLPLIQAPSNNVITGSGGGGMGGGPILRTNFTPPIKNLSNISTETVKILTYSQIADLVDEKIADFRINVTSNASGNLKITLLKNRPAYIPDPDMLIYQYLEVLHDIPDDDISNVDKEFGVKKEWIINNNLHETDIQLLRYDNGWYTLNTYVTGEDDTYVYYAASSKGLSIFAIAAKTTPLIEQPLIIEAKSFIYWPYIIALAIIIATIIILKPGKIITNNKINAYITQGLYAGYEYNAIYNVLKKHYDIELLNHHIKELQSQGLKPIIRYKTAQKRTVNNVEQTLQALKIYVKNQTKAGYEIKDIKQVLIHYGHDKDLVEEAIAS